MDAKWVFAAGLGAGAVLALRLSEKQISSIKNFASDISQSPNLEAAKRVTTDKVQEMLRRQGTNLVDKLADSLKQTLLSEPLTDTSSLNHDGHVVIDGKTV